MQQSSSSQSGAERAPSSWSRHAQDAASVGTLILLEMLPVEALLLILTGLNHETFGRRAIPFWLLCGTMLCACGVARLLRRFGLWAMLIAGAPIYTITLLVIAATSSEGTQVVLILAVALAYVWWRGLMLGSAIPGIDETLRRFALSASAIVLALVGIAAVPPDVRKPFIGALSLVLPADIFSGLLAVALARVAFERVRRFGNLTPARERTWLGTAVALASFVVLLALLVNAVVNFDNVSAALRQLGPVGVALDGASRWLIDTFARLLYFILSGPIQALYNLWVLFTRRSAPSLRRPTNPCATNPQSTQCSVRPPESSYSYLGLFIIEGIVIAIACIICVVLLRSLLARRLPDGQLAIEEERESLQRPVRGQRLSRAQRNEADVPAPGTVRAIYRDVLRAAERSGLGRTASETPDEYARRLVDAAPLAGAEAERGDVVALSAAYEGARYGEREPVGEERATLQGRARRLIERLRSHPRQAR